MAPTVAPVLTEVADGGGTFQAGVYTFSYTYFNDFGETTQSPLATITITGVNSRVQIGRITSVPSGVLGLNYYCSIQPGDATVDLIDPTQLVFVAGEVSATVKLPGGVATTSGYNYNGTAYAVIAYTPNPFFGVIPPLANTTSADFFRLHEIMQRINPGGVPEIWNTLGGHLYRRIGDTKIILEFMPIPQFPLRFNMTATLPILGGETDSTNEPTELIYHAAEYFLWNLQVKTSTIVNVSWQKLAQESWTKYQQYLSMYRMDVPKDYAHRPVITTLYS